MPVSNDNNRLSRPSGALVASTPKVAESKPPEKFVKGQVSIEAVRKDGQLHWDVTFENHGRRPFVGTIAFVDANKNAGEGFESMPVAGKGWKVTQHISSTRNHGVTPKPGELLRLQVRGLSYLELPLPKEGTVQLPLDSFEPMPKLEGQYFKTNYVKNKVGEKSNSRFRDGSLKLEIHAPNDSVVRIPIPDSGVRSTIPEDVTGYRPHTFFTSEYMGTGVPEWIEGELVQRADGALLLELPAPATVQLCTGQRGDGGPQGFEVIDVNVWRRLWQGKVEAVLLTDTLKVPLNIAERLRERGACKVELRDFDERNLLVPKSPGPMDAQCLVAGRFNASKDINIVLAESVEQE